MKVVFDLGFGNKNIADELEFPSNQFINKWFNGKSTGRKMSTSIKIFEQI
jgi:hypothetical protein